MCAWRIESDKEFIAVIIGLATGLATLLWYVWSFNENEKCKRSFHFIEQTWIIKHKLFDNLLTKTHQIFDNVNSAFHIKDSVSFSSSPLDSFGKLVEFANIAHRVEGTISKADIEKLNLMDTTQIQSNISFLEGIKKELIRYYYNRGADIAMEALETKSKLNLIIFDISILEDFQRVGEYILNQGKKLGSPTKFNRKLFLEKVKDRNIKITKKMRAELIEMMGMDLEELKEKMMLMDLNEI